MVAVEPPPESASAAERTPTVVLYDSDDVGRYFAAGPRAGAVLPLSPSAQAALKGTDLTVINPRSRFNDCAYARALVRIKRSERQFASAIDLYGQVHESAKHCLIYVFQAVALSAVRMWVTIGRSGPWIVPENGAWVTTEDRARAHEILLRNLMMGPRYDIRGWYVYRAPPMAGLFRVLRQALVPFLRTRGPSVVARRSKHRFGFHGPLAAVSPKVRQYHVSQCEAGWLEYVRLFREVWRAWRGDFQVQVKAVIGESVIDEDRFEDVVHAVSDPEIRRGLDVIRPRMLEVARQVDGIVDDFNAVIGALSPDYAWSYENAEGFSAALAEACGAQGITRLVIGHNSLAPTSSRVAALGMGQLVETQYRPSLTDEYLFLTPPGFECGRQFLPPEVRGRLRPIAAIKLASREAGTGHSAAGDRVRRVLQTPNSLRWFNFHSWIFEHHEEYIDGAIALVQAMQNIPEAELIIRNKKIEMHALEALLRPHGRFMMKSRGDNPFEEDLALADLLVAYTSTTIMQALHARKPVLLWGGTQRYQHLPARATPPTADDRAAVYVVKSEADLAPMIAAILDAHAGRPLTDQELDGYVWPAGTPDFGDLAQAIANRNLAQLWEERGTEQ